jgi:hypothetical protein
MNDNTPKPEPLLRAAAGGLLTGAWSVKKSAQQGAEKPR